MKIIPAIIPIDPLPLHERVNMRLSYLRAITSGLEEPIKNPFEEILHQKNLAPIYPIEIPSYLTPFPEPADIHAIGVDEYKKFIENGGLAKLSDKISTWVKNQNLPSLTISPDHSVTYGILKGVKHDKNLLVLIFDAHLDVTSPDLSMKNLHAGNFVKKLYEEEKNFEIVILGAQDDPDLHPEIYQSIPAEIRKTYPLWKEKVKVFNYIDLINSGETIIEDVVDKTQANDVYISIDIDVASGKDVWGVRFFEGRWPSKERFVEIIEHLFYVLKQKNKKITGVDFCEWDPLLMNIPIRGNKEDGILPIFEFLLDKTLAY